jgi:hypothetical protein
MTASMKPNLRERLEAVAGRSVARLQNINDEGNQRLRAVVAAEFGTSAAIVFCSSDCPALDWLRRIIAGSATPDETALFNTIAGKRYFTPPITTAAYLLAIPRVMAR